MPRFSTHPLLGSCVQRPPSVDDAPLDSSFSKKKMAAGRIGALLAGDKAQRATAYEELATIASGDESDPVATATACIAPLLDVLSLDASRVDRAEAQRVNLLISSLMMLDPLTVGEPWLRDARFLEQWNSRDNVLAAMVAKQPAELTRDDVLLAACDGLPIVMMWAKGWTQCCEAAGLDEMGGYQGWCASNPFNPLNNHKPTTDEWNIRLVTLALEVCRDPQGLSEQESAAVWGLISPPLIGQRPAVGAAAVNAGLFDVAVATLRKSLPAEWTSWRSFAGIQAGMIFSAIAQMLITGAPVDHVRLQIDSGFANGVVSMLQVREPLRVPSLCPSAFPSHSSPRRLPPSSIQLAALFRGCLTRGWMLPRRLS